MVVHQYARLRRAYRSVEQLESRLALAGVTVITHGFQLTGSFPDWAITMGQAVLDRADGDRVDRSTGSMYKHDPATGDWVSLSSAIWNNSNREDEDVVLLFDWADDSNNFSNGWLDAAADSLFASLLKTNDNLTGPIAARSFADIAIDSGLVRAAAESLPPLMDLHFIGHSRGAVLNSLVTERFATRFPALAIDQVTSLDPHPASSMSDPGYVAANPDINSRLSTFSNVLFADNYYRRDGSYEADFDFNGVMADGAFNLRLPESVLAVGGSSTEHSDIHTWYYGTITATLPVSYAGYSGATRDHDGDSSFPATWWDRPEVTDGDPIPARGATGFHFSSIGGGDRSQLSITGEKRTASDKPWIANGDFAIGDNNTFSADGIPGWQEHGGSHDADLTSDGRLRLGESGLSNFTRATHNLFYVPAAADQIVFDYQVTDSSDDDMLVVTVGTSTQSYSLASTGQFTGQLSLEPYRNDAVTIDFLLDAGSLIGSELYIDNVHLTTTPGIAGDLDRNGRRDSRDIDLMFAALRADWSNPEYDLDQSGTVTAADADYLIEHLFGTYYGDANLDGKVDAMDFSVWNDNRFTDCHSWKCGNFNVDRSVDVRDFHQWQLNRFRDNSVASAALSQSPRAALAYVVQRSISTDLLRRRGVR